MTLTQDENGHNWLTVGNRRWCMSCDAFDSYHGDRWHPGIKRPCPKVYTAWEAEITMTGPRGAMTGIIRGGTGQ